VSKKPHDNIYPI